MQTCSQTVRLRLLLGFFGFFFKIYKKTIRNRKELASSITTHTWALYLSRQRRIGFCSLLPGQSQRLPGSDLWGQAVVVCTYGTRTHRGRGCASPVLLLQLRPRNVPHTCLLLTGTARPSAPGISLPFPVRRDAVTSLVQTRRSRGREPCRLLPSLAFSDAPSNSAASKQLSGFAPQHQSEEERT